jgi:hypothetical protein
MMRITKEQRERAAISLTIIFLIFVWMFWHPTGAQAQGQWSTAGNGTDSYTGGNVGIGTSTPGAPLEVNKSQNAGTTIAVDNGYTTPGNAAYSGFFFRQGGVNRFFFGSINSGNTVQHGGPGAVQFWNYTAGPMLFATNNVERIRIDASGKVGIGAATPNARLQMLSEDPYLSGLYNSANWNNTGSPLTALFGTPNNNGGNSPATAEPALVLFRNGVNSQAYNNYAEFKLSRYESSGTMARTRLDIALNYTNEAAPGTVMSLRSDGNVGIGTATPTYKLDVVGAVNVASICIAGVCKNSWSEIGGGGSSQWGNSGTASIYYTSGNVGIGTTDPQNSLQLGTQVSTTTSTPVSFSLGGTFSSTAGTNLKLKLYDDGNPANIYGIGVSTGSMDFGVNSGGGYNWYVGSSNKLTLTNSGNVGIGKTPAVNVKLDVAGDLNASGKITGGIIEAKYQDVAEWVPSSQKLSAGTVVILDSEKSNQVIASKESYDTRVAGVISEQPGVLLGEGGEGKVKVATTGRVKVKVDATRGPIRIGDLLVTSDREGVAMKSEPLLVQGRRIHAPGTIIGKALQALESGVSEIQVLLSLQ